MSTPDPTASKSLRDVRREQAAERRNLRNQRSLARERRESLDKARDQGRFVLKQNAVVTGLVPRISGAIDSWTGKRVPLSVEHPTSQFYAYTDFTSINIAIPAIRDDQELTVDFAADLRGLAYHEAGHILMTVPFLTILDHVMPLAEGRSPHARSQSLNTWLGSQDGLHHTWNMLEDQRMETAMVAQSRNLGRYYNVIVLTHVLNGDVSPRAYLLLYGRKHVDETVRVQARAAMVAATGEQVVQEAEAIIDAYQAAGTLDELWSCVTRFHKLTGGAEDLDDMDGHADGGEISDEDASKRLDRSQAPGTPEVEEGEGQDGDGHGQGSESDDDADEDGETADGDGEADDDDEAEGSAPSVADRGSKGEGSGGEGAADHSTGEALWNKEWNRDTLREAIRQAKQERNQDRSIIGDLRAFNEALAKANDSLPIKRIPVVGNPNPLLTHEATKLNRVLRNLMEQARAERAPSWQRNQRHGVLDVIRYKTRQAGDMEFFTEYAEGGDMHLPNMAVSLVLDGSGSMQPYNDDLATAAFGVKSACDVVGVPCTVTVYDTRPYLLWDQNDRPLEVPFDIVPCGGTDPKTTLDLLDGQMAGKDHHLVIIMTDGQWGGGWNTGKRTLTDYMVPHRDIVLFFWNTSMVGGPKGMEQCSTAEQIDTLDAIPQFLRRYILRAM
jgi:hypothetical protein